MPPGGGNQRMELIDLARRRFHYRRPPGGRRLLTASGHQPKYQRNWHKPERRRARARPHHEGIGTSRGFAFQLNPSYIFICRPLPKSPPEQLSSLLMQLSIHMAMTVSSQAPNQSAWRVAPLGRFGNIASEESVHLLVSSPVTIEYQAPSLKVGIT